MQCPKCETHQSPKATCGWCGAPLASSSGRDDFDGSRPDPPSLIGDPNFDPKGDDELSV